ncbi:hypothetical protein JD844_003831 [Phrynosoma platyrhinos]|uniref:Cytochrome c oxidase subunit NDUFA4 n=1 Tax=Phrynosoma platyrhinos TaxID=52577 RepID=A0ABQ7TDJ0_PHRPL|nr:hypothetical protein JD844_003831 [Phrynosoma platyrhinos]
MGETVTSAHWQFLLWKLLLELNGNILRRFLRRFCERKEEGKEGSVGQRGSAAAGLSPQAPRLEGRGGPDEPLPPPQPKNQKEEPLHRPPSSATAEPLNASPHRKYARGTEMGNGLRATPRARKKHGRREQLPLMEWCARSDATAIMFRLMASQAKKHPSLIPLFIFIGAGGTGAALYIMRLALRNPDVWQVPLLLSAAT